MLPSEGNCQLTIDGGEVTRTPYYASTALTQAQRVILRLLAERDTITSSEAGRIVHAHRNPPCARCAAGGCGFIASDGGDALKRLRTRGYVCRLGAGLWTRASIEHGKLVAR